MSKHYPSCSFFVPRNSRKFSPSNSRRKLSRKFSPPKVSRYTVHWARLRTGQPLFIRQNGWACSMFQGVLKWTFQCVSDYKHALLTSKGWLPDTLCLSVWSSWSWSCWRPQLCLHVFCQKTRSIITYHSLRSQSIRTYSFPTFFFPYPKRSARAFVNRPLIPCSSAVEKWQMFCVSCDSAPYIPSQLFLLIRYGIRVHGTSGFDVNFGSTQTINSRYILIMPSIQTRWNTSCFNRCSTSWVHGPSYLIRSRCLLLCESSCCCRGVLSYLHSRWWWRIWPHSRERPMN